MTENPEASVLTARRAPQHVRLSSADDAYEHLCILTLLPSLAPLHLMLADTPWPHGFGATLANVGPLSEGFERSVASPLYLVGYVRWDARSDRFLLCQTIIPTAFRSQSELPTIRFWAAFVSLRHSRCASLLIPLLFVHAHHDEPQS